MLSSIFYGLRVSLGVGALSGLIALIVGAVLGLSAAYFGGRYETFVMRVVDIQLSFPSILMALVILAIFGKIRKNHHCADPCAMGLLCPCGTSQCTG